MCIKSEVLFFYTFMTRKWTVVIICFNNVAIHLTLESFSYSQTNIVGVLHILYTAAL